jgi:hypothetical protein
MIGLGAVPEEGELEPEDHLDEFEEIYDDHFDIVDLDEDDFDLYDEEDDYDSDYDVDDESQVET